MPPYLPDTPEIRSDLLDAYLEVEWFDRHLGAMLALLEQAGELDNTLVIVTGDNGMTFPRAKANVYEDGIHVPLAVRYGAKVPGGRKVDDLVGFVDLTATILDATGTAMPADAPPAAGRSLMNMLTSTREGQVDASRTAVYAARERHSSSRYNNWTYPQRALRTPQYLYIRNFRPERWPAGDPVMLRPNGVSAGPHSGYKDIDACPSLSFLIARADHPVFGRFLDLAVAHRPAEELFDITRDPGCLVNLASDPALARVREGLARQLDEYLRTTGDPRALDGGEIWESYPRHSAVRNFPLPSK